MKTKIRSILALCALVSVQVLFSACSKQVEPTATVPTEAKHYPLKGVIVEVQTDQSSLLVKHEAIPGYMMAMTMVFNVDAVTLKSVVKDEAITGTLVLRGEEMWLEDIKPVLAAK